MSEIINVINNKLKTLIRLIDIDKVITEFRSKPIFDEYLEILDVVKDPESKIQIILKKVVNNKVEINEFIHILLHTGQDSAALMLAPEAIDFVDLSRFSPIDQKDLFMRIPNVSMSNAYGMSRPRGFCFLLNNYFTTGTYNEMQRFRNIFYHLDFEVIIRKNLDANEIYKELLLLSKSDKMKDYSAFMFMSITHGNENAEIYGFDGKTLEIKELVELFNNEKCPHLKLKPRMFFFNCCRGYDSVKRTATTLGQKDREFIRKTLPEIQDFIICYSTLDGYLAEVDWDKGTKFGKALADSFIERGLYKDLNALLILANQKVGDTETRQPIVLIQSLRRQVFFLLRTDKK